MRKLEIYYKGIFAGILTEESPSKYIFNYDKLYFTNPKKPAISLTLPKSKLTHHNKFLFPVFFNLLSEGANQKLQCRHLRIDEKDYFSLLAVTAVADTIGAITVKPIEVS